MSNFRNTIRKPGFASFMSSVFAVVIGLLFGLVLLLIFNPSHAFYGFSQILFSGSASLDKLGKVLYQASPLIMTGLSVGFAFKTGLFNIGASGQYLIGALFALITGVVLKQPWYVALLVSLLGGAIWGAIPGIFKAFFNVNEVITSIMFNWIGLFLVNFTFSNIPSVLANFYGASNPDRTANLGAANPSAIIPKMGLEKIFGASYINISIFIAMIVAVISFIIIQKTTFGYELKACGYNKNASIYAGINAKRNIVLSMLIAGAFAGLGGGIYYLSGTIQYTIEKVLVAMGFNGIPVALLANSHPLGTIVSALFISYIQVGGEAMQPEFAKESVDIIISIIIYLSAFSLLIKGTVLKFLNKKKSLSSDLNVAGSSEEPTDNEEVIQ